ncbi:transmembrane protein 74B [Silurus asotus]|uniref:Transmembrane protein 74B n=1 Tax=Silurus asotus TaxID=30991 RepID=A0AAD5AP57_SILAS|nr:transmembrane protein 74B [Silurus asotus]
MECVNGVELHELSRSGHGIENTSFCDEEHEARVCVVNSKTGQHFSTHSGGGNSHQIPQGDVHSDEEQEAVYEERSVDYSFMLALVFLVSGIALVIIAYAIPREARINPDQVTARQMEKLEMYYAQLGTHLDKCIIAGLGLLTLGGMLLSILLMVSLCKGELYHHRSFAILRRPMKSYGSINMRMGQLASGNGREPIMDCDSSTGACNESAEGIQHLRQTQ